MQPYFNDPHLLPTAGAAQLYRDAAALPIIDYRSRIDPALIAADRQYANVTELWLLGDSEKRRAMRNCGVAEALITGGASDYEKLHAFVSILPALTGSPLSARARAELRMLGYDGTLTPSAAEEIWTCSNETIEREAITARRLLSHLNVTLLCTVTDPADPLTSYDTISSDPTCAVGVIPLFCPDRLSCGDAAGKRAWVRTLSGVLQCKIDSLDALKTALCARMDAFGARGCRSALHTLPPTYRFSLPETPTEPEAVFARLLAGQPVSEREHSVLFNELLRHCAQSYAARGWVMQLSLGAVRDANTLLRRRLGEGLGFDITGMRAPIAEIMGLFDLLTVCDAMPRILLSCDAPADFAPALAAASAFQVDSNGMPRIVPTCSSFYWCGTNDICAQLSSLSAHFPLGCAAAAPAEAETPLSCLRADTFRRLLCARLDLIADGDYADLSRIAADLCYHNIKRFFGF